jgi:hypothetical protein
MKKKFSFLALGLFCLISASSLFGVSAEGLGALLSPNMPVESIPKDLKLPDAVLPILKNEFNNSIGKQASFDIQFKIVMLTTLITNLPSEKYSFLEEVVMWEVKSYIKTAQKITAISPDARVLAIKAMSDSSNSNFVPTMLAVIERDTTLKPRIMAAKILPALGNNNLIVPKLVDLLKNQYGSSRAKFNEENQQRFDDDRVAQAIIETLGELGDPRAFSVLLQAVMNPEMHRDDTVKAGWEAIKKIKW